MERVGGSGWTYASSNVGSISCFDGMPVVYKLVSAHTDEREAAEAVMYFLRGCYLIGDKVFLIKVQTFEVAACAA